MRKRFTLPTATLEEQQQNMSNILQNPQKKKVKAII